MRATILILLAASAWGQVPLPGTNGAGDLLPVPSTIAPTPTPAPVAPPATTFLQSMLDPLTLSLAAYDLSQVAMSATAWKWTMAGKQYSVSAPRVTAITFVATIGGAALAHKWPKLKTPLTIVLGGVAAWYAGVAMSQAQNHGVQK